MASLNRTQLIGHAVQAPELRKTASGKPACQIVLYTNERWTDKATGALKESKERHRVQVYGRRAEVAAEFVKAGTLLYIDGKNRTRKYTDGNDIERYVTEVVTRDLQLLGGSRSDAVPHDAHDHDDVPLPSDHDDDDQALPL